MSVSSRSNTKVYVLCLASPSSAGRKGGDTFGRFVKLFGNLAMLVLAMADAFSMAKGFFPVRELPELLPPPLTKLLVPLVLVVLEMPFYWAPPE